MNGTVELRALANALLALADRMDGAPARVSSGTANAPAQNVITGSVASDADLDGQYGNPVVRIDPKRGWEGESMRGRTFSDCPPEYLEALANFLDWAAQNPQPGKEQYASRNAKDAARARGWARRNSQRVETPRADDNPFTSSSGAGSSVDGDDDIPF